MKKIIYIVSALFTLPLINSCSQHEVPFYDGKDAIYFDQQWSDFANTAIDTVMLPHQIYSFIPFGLRVEDDTLLRVKVETTGYVRDYDRPFGIEIVADSTTASEGAEFEILDKNPVIKAGENLTYIPVLCHRTNRIMVDTAALQLQIRLVPGEHFSLPFGEEGVGKIPGRYNQDGNTLTARSNNWDPAIHNIFISGKYDKPNRWHNVQFGRYFSQKKFSLILKVMEEDFGWSIAEFNNPTISDRAYLIAIHVSTYLMEQYYKGREHWVIDEDGSMMYVKGVIWPEGQDPDKFN